MRKRIPDFNPSKIFESIGLVLLYNYRTLPPYYNGWKSKVVRILVRLPSILGKIRTFSSEVSGDAEVSGGWLYSFITMIWACAAQYRIISVLGVLNENNVFNRHGNELKSNFMYSLMPDHEFIWSVSYVNTV